MKSRIESILFKSIARKIYIKDKNSGKDHLLGFFDSVPLFVSNLVFQSYLQFFMADKIKPDEIVNLTEPVRVILSNTFVIEKAVDNLMKEIELELKGVFKSDQTALVLLGSNAYGGAYLSSKVNAEKRDIDLGLILDPEEPEIMTETLLKIKTVLKCYRYQLCNQANPENINIIPLSYIENKLEVFSYNNSSYPLFFFPTYPQNISMQNFSELRNSLQLMKIADPKTYDNLVNSYNSEILLYHKFKSTHFASISTLMYHSKSFNKLADIFSNLVRRNRLKQMLNGELKIVVK